MPQHALSSFWLTVKYPKSHFLPKLTPSIILMFCLLVAFPFHHSVFHSSAVLSPCDFHPHHDQSSSRQLRRSCVFLCSLKLTSPHEWFAKVAKCNHKNGLVSVNNHSKMQIYLFVIDVNMMTIHPQKASSPPPRPPSAIVPPHPISGPKRLLLYPSSH